MSAVLETRPVIPVLGDPGFDDPGFDDPGFDDHIAALGLISKSGYLLWCRRHGFSMALHKSPAESAAELEHLRRMHDPDDPEADPRHDPRRVDFIRRIAAGELDGDKLTDVLSRVRNLFAEVTDVDGGRDALLRLLLHVEKYGNLLISTRGFGGLPASQRNLVISGLSRLARHHRDWIRPVEMWRPTTRKPDAQFAELVAHLLARYPVPAPLNGAWFEADRRESEIQQRWYKHVGSGQNIRTAAELPFALTKRAAHHFMNSGSRTSPLRMLRLAQIHTMVANANPRHAWGLAWHERIQARENADFWTSIIHFVLNNPMLEGSYVGPLVDYIHYTKFEPRRIPQPDGAIRLAPPVHPRFCIKARSIGRLVREVDDWHEQLSGEEYDHVEEWAPCGIDGFSLTEDNQELQARIHWSIHELRTSALLQVEGRIMHHCVGSYAKRCVAGETSVWSLRSRKDEEEAEEHHVLTVAIDNGKRQVTQARGKFNLQPHGRRSGNQARRTDSNYRVALRESARILSLWRTRESLGFSQD